MADMKQIHEFAIKWFAKFREKETNYIELVDHYMADDCEALGFVMDCGHAFVEKYGNAASDCEALERIISQVTDTQLLGSAIYSQWRYFNHWAYSGEEILAPKNREWFLIALSHLGELANRQLFRRCTDEDLAPPNEQHHMSKIALLNASCADQTVDAVVNAANSGLRAGGGICGVIFKKGWHGRADGCLQRIQDAAQRWLGCYYPSIQYDQCQVHHSRCRSRFRKNPGSLQGTVRCLLQFSVCIDGQWSAQHFFPADQCRYFRWLSGKSCCRAYKKFIADHPNYDVDVKRCAFSAKEMQAAQKVFDGMI